ncbi:MAG: hypothetical protein LJE87_15690 [Deltaproteobacteria bacterium]|jgi:hypothetical protein|nr:hypothetical protein [Deltaproteobacteria bacterium]
MTSGHKSPAKDPIVIRGLLVPVDWDEKGNITETAVSTYFEEEYRIERNVRGEALLPFLRQKVKVSGLVRIDNRGKKVVRVEEYEVIEE